MLNRFLAARSFAIPVEKRNGSRLFGVAPERTLARSFLGDDYFDNVVLVRIPNTRFAAFEDVASLQDVRNLRLNGTSISSLVPIARLKKLQPSTSPIRRFTI